LFNQLRTDSNIRVFGLSGFGEYGHAKPILSLEEKRMVMILPESHFEASLSARAG
jgi:hypothetical protein